MSGIAGYLFYEDISEELVNKKIISMLNPLIINQKDRIEFHVDKHGCAIGICNNGHVNTAKIFQDKTSEYVVVFNGCLTNTKDLIAMTGISNLYEENFEAVIIKRLFEKFNKRLVEFIQGIYAFAIWDPKRRNLTIGTDRYGFEYIYFYHDKEKFLFGSEIKAILSVIESRLEANTDAICDIHNYHMILGTKTSFKEIQLMPHAAIFHLNKDRHSIKQYWDYPIHVEHNEDSEENLMRRSKELIKNATRKNIKNIKNV